MTLLFIHVKHPDKHEVGNLEKHCLMIFMCTQQVSVSVMRACVCIVCVCVCVLCVCVCVCVYCVCMNVRVLDCAGDWWN